MLDSGIVMGQWWPKKVTSRGSKKITSLNFFHEICPNLALDNVPLVATVGLPAFLRCRITDPTAGEASPSDFFSSLLLVGAIFVWAWKTDSNFHFTTAFERCKRFAVFTGCVEGGAISMLICSGVFELRFKKRLQLKIAEAKVQLNIAALKHSAN